jgi:hypothetical protein
MGQKPHKNHAGPGNWHRNVSAVLKVSIATVLKVLNKIQDKTETKPL